MTENSSDKARMRQKRLGAALKANLQKRKSQTRARRQTGEGTEQVNQGDRETLAPKPPQQDG